MPLTKRAVVFDLDGTVLDTIRDLAVSLNRALDAFGYETHSVDTVRSYVGNGFRMLVRRALPEGCDDGVIDAVCARFKEEYSSHLVEFTEPYEGMPELIAELSESGISVAVVTNKDDSCAGPIIRHFFGDSVAICRGVRVDSDRKPSPTVTLSVLSELGVAPSDAFFVGDGIADFETAKNCGIEFIPLGYGFTQPEVLSGLCGKRCIMTVSNLREELFSLLQSK